MIQVSRVLLAQLVLLTPTYLLANQYLQERLVMTLPAVVMRTSACPTMEAVNNAATLLQHVQQLALLLPGRVQSDQEICTGSLRIYFFNRIITFLFSVQANLDVETTLNETQTAQNAGNTLYSIGMANAVDIAEIAGLARIRTIGLLMTMTTRV